MSHIYIEPGRSNSAAEDAGHWKIMFEDNGKSRHLNDGTSKEDAAGKAEKAAVKRGVPFEGGFTNHKKITGEAAPIIKKDYMDVQPPRGAPKVGDFVTFKAPDNTIYEGKVVGYLAEQFIIEYMAPTQRVVHMNEDWKVQ